MDKTEVQNLILKWKNDGLISEAAYQLFKSKIDSVSDDKLSDVLDEIIKWLDQKVTDLDVEILELYKNYSENLEKIKLAANDPEISKMIDNYNDEVSTILDDFNKELEEVDSLLDETDKILEEIK
jgi:hypothetical protein